MAEITPQLVGALVLFLVLGAFVLHSVLRSGRQIAGSRGVYQIFAQRFDGHWLPPKNPADRLGPGRVKATYRERRVTLDATVPRGSSRDQLPETILRVKLGRSLRAGLHGGSGTFRARHAGSLELADPRLTKTLRAKAKDEAVARAVLGAPEVAASLLAVHAASRGVGIDDGTISCAIALPLSVDELTAAADLLVDASRAVDEASARL